MKTTIKLGGGKCVVVMPGGAGTVRVDMSIMGVGVGGMNLDPNECGALLFAVEQAAEAAGIALDRQRAETFGACDYGTTMQCDKGPLCKAFCVGRGQPGCTA